MVLAIGFRDGDNQILAALREWRPPFSPDQVVQEAAALLKSYKSAGAFQTNIAATGLLKGSALMASRSASTTKPRRKSIWNYHC